MQPFARVVALPRLKVPHFLQLIGLSGLPNLFPMLLMSSQATAGLIQTRPLWHLSVAANVGFAEKPTNLRKNFLCAADRLRYEEPR